MRLFLGSALLAIGAATAQPVLAQPAGPGPAMMGPGGPMGGHHPRHIERMLDSVNATEAQRTQIRQILANAGTGMKAQHDAARALHDRMRAILSAPTIDTNAAEQVRLQMQAQHDQASRQRLQVMIDVAQVLTPEQRAKAAELMARRGDRMREHMRDRPARDGAPRS
jgi:Spy/CpxP family protein refolding chaperone